MCTETRLLAELKTVRKRGESSRILASRSPESSNRRDRHSRLAAIDDNPMRGPLFINIIALWVSTSGKDQREAGEFLLGTARPSVPAARNETGPHWSSTYSPAISRWLFK